jgi:ankyrin repeat protein
LELAQFLVEHGADAAAQDNDGQTPIDRASEMGHLKLAQSLVEQHADNSTALSQQRRTSEEPFIPV